MWPDVARTLTGWLLRSGFDRGTVEDAVQETAARALAHEIEFTDAADLLRWARVVARNVAIDASRRASFVVPGEVPDRPGVQDVEYVVEQRRRLEVLPVAFETLSANDQHALRLGQVDRLPDLDRKRHAVRLHRARARLLVLVETLAGWLAWVTRPRLRARTAVVAVPVVLVVAITLRPLFLNTTPVKPDNPPTAVSAGAARGNATQPVATDAAPPVLAAPKASTTATTRKPYFEVGVPRGGGKPPVPVGVRPKTPEDHLACLDTIVAGYRCIDLTPGLDLGGPPKP